MATVEYEYKVGNPDTNRLQEYLSKEGKNGWKLTSLHLYHSVATVVMEKQTNNFPEDSWGL